MRRRIARWRKDEQGVVAIEFAMISIPFFLMLTGIVETALYFATSIVIEGGVTSASRLVRTGQLEGEDDPEAVFQEALCNQVDDIINCADLQYEAIPIGEGTFAAVGEYEPVIDEDGNVVTAGFNAGDSEQIVLIRAFYRYEFLTPMISRLMLPDSGQDYVLIIATAIIKNEPYEFGYSG